MQKMQRRSRKKTGERYELERSPLAQSPTQKDIAALVRETKSDLKTLATGRFKEQFLVRRTITTNGKTRELVYPEGRLRAVHERLKFHLSKIVQPSYLMSPRKGRAQRDNAAAHLDAAQFLTLDLRQFYPSTTRQMIRNSLAAQFGMQTDVAGLIGHLATADDCACFGSPLTPVLAALVHRPMFDRIADRCRSDDLSYTVWVDDLTISGERLTGDLRTAIRAIISEHGLRSHKLKTYTGNRAVFITGVGVVGSNLVVPRRLELRSKELWAELKACETFEEKDTSSTRLLSHLGGIRAVVGPSSQRGQKIASEMNSIRQKREKARRSHQQEFLARTSGALQLSDSEKIARKAEIDALPF
ncbi:reverse transcriptase family protein [Alisedimentitalea sp. MJ-SS2]|uniref:reverse transcriptase family protein n=1 Tax=Aliisedimentitalea sp. MJ-SS2 TaxID=3049795 RepID=UPI0029132801|nr:reverse transcriptase family protein [Alisedimentitalea sp. MJ-SS2]MDU8928224.1 reverse transcriptase family protein [Alisedimentitalea sp. MJ-SS2]